MIQNFENPNLLKIQIPEIPHEILHNFSNSEDLSQKSVILSSEDVMIPFFSFANQRRTINQFTSVIIITHIKLLL